MVAKVFSWIFGPYDAGCFAGSVRFPPAVFPTPPREIATGVSTTGGTGTWCGPWPTVNASPTFPYGTRKTDCEIRIRIVIIPCINTAAQFAGSVDAVPGINSSLIDRVSMPAHADYWKWAENEKEKMSSQ